MIPFGYIRAASVNEACSVLDDYGTRARIIAGGTDLLPQLRYRDFDGADTILDISRLDPLRGVVESNDAIAIRPLTTHSGLMRSEIIRVWAPCLAVAASTIGSPQIRNRGTVGGNIMNAATCADTVPPLVALGAQVVLQSAQGTRSLELDALFTAPYQTRSLPNEILTEIRFPKPRTRTRSSFVKLGRRNALSIARLSVAVVVSQGKDGVIADARIVPGAAFPTWRRIPEGEQMLIGNMPSEQLFAQAGQKVSEVMTAHVGKRWSGEYKIPVLAVLVRRALEDCVRKNGNADDLN